MSSYVTSPFVLEERRLQGIVNQCCADLNSALQKVQEQQRLMQQKEAEQREKDNSYFVSERAAETARQRDVQMHKMHVAQKKKQLREMLEQMQIELDAFKRMYAGMETLQERQNQLLHLVESTSENLDELESSIVHHIQKTEEQVKIIAEERAGRGFRSDTVMVTKQIKKGISLQMEVPGETAKRHTETPLHTFVYKMKMAMESPASSRFPSLLQLKREFDSQPEYAKSAFAVRNIKKLDEILRQLEMISKNAKADSDKREKFVAQYRAVCRLINVEVDEKLIEDKKSTRRLVQIYEDLFKKYQEQKKHTYVANAVATVMERHGIIFEDSKHSPWGNIMQFSMDHATIDISGAEGSQLTFEVSGKYEGDAPTVNEKRKSVASAQKVCSLMQTIEYELREEYGILFGRMLREEPSEETMVMKKASGESGSRKHATTKKQLADML